MTTDIHRVGLTSLLATIEERLRTLYVVPEAAELAVKALRERWAGGSRAGEEAVEGQAFATAITAVLQAATGDKHLRLEHCAERLPAAETDTGPEAGRLPKALRSPLDTRANNGGFSRVERLPGNVGLLDLRNFYAPTRRVNWPSRP
ncbi:hypothetical protein [Streptomyces sp. KR80]|uniref:hypothetical protein n=1 Tax=Streptomyces sp. KR80 TaxID=3457426 RepID=UPI003FD3AA3B